MPNSTYLRSGSNGPVVSAVQWILNETDASDPDLHVDGVFGNLTQRAVVAFQRQTSLLPDGVVGPRTLKKFVQAVTSESGSYSNQHRPPQSMDGYAFQPPASPMSGGGGNGSGGGGGGTSDDKKVEQLRSIVKPRGLQKLPSGNYVIGLIYFKTDSHTLDWQDKSELNKISVYLKNWQDNPNSAEIKFRYDGWCDTTGTFEHNNRLARKRAAAVERYVRNQVVNNHEKYSYWVNPKGRKWKAIPKEEPAERVVMIIAPRAKKLPKKKKKKPTIRERVSRCFVVLAENPAPPVRQRHLMCVLSKLSAEETGGLGVVNDDFWLGNNIEFRRAMSEMRGRLTDSEIKAWKKRFRDALLGPAFAKDKSAKDIRDNLLEIDDHIVQSIAWVSGQMNTKESSVQYEALRQVFHHIFGFGSGKDGLINKYETLYHCYRDLMKK